MDDNEVKKPETETSNDYKFLQEKIKERPIDKKKLLQRTVVTASLALLFGLIACLTFLILEPVLNNLIFPEEEPEVITFPQEEDEMLPEDMLTEEDLQINKEQVEEETSSEPEATVDNTQTSVYINEGATTEEEETEDTNPYYLVDEQTLLYQQLYEKYKEVSTSMVTVTAVENDIDWFNNAYQSEGETAGVIIGNNNRYLLILCKKSPLDAADVIQVTFCNNVSAEGTIKAYDQETDLAIVQVEIKNIKDTVMDSITIATLGSSVSSSLTGTPIIAIGNIQGYKDNVCYGMITSVGNVLSLEDAQYKLITTDIYGSENPSGILVSMTGQVLGFIDNAHNNKDIKNMVCAVGITEMKGMISNLSNGIEIAHLGLYIKDISSSVRVTLGLPQGAYVYDVTMDSPAMDTGIQKGDVVVKVGDKDIKSAAEYTSAIREHEPDDEISITVKRASQDEYKEIEFNVTLTN